MTQEETFYSKYTLVKNTLVEDASWDGSMFETFGDEIQEILKYANDDKKSKHIWTILDCNGKMYIAAGYHMINRLGYLISQEPWNDLNEEYLCEGGFGEEIYYFEKCEVETDEAWYDLIHKQLELPKFHNLFDGDNFKEDYKEYFDEDFNIDIDHENIFSSNKDNFELLCDSFKLTDLMKKELIENTSTRFYTIKGIDYGVELTNYKSFEAMTNNDSLSIFILNFSKYE